MSVLLNRIFGTIYALRLDDAVVIALLLTIGWGLLGRHWGEKNLWRAINAVGVICSIAVILYGTLLTRTPHGRELSLVPFHSFAAAKLQRELYRSMLMNVIFFMPLGVSGSSAFPRSWKWWTRIGAVVLLGLCLSVAVEVCQYCFFLGRCETDDVIMNTLGTLLGAFLIEMCCREKAVSRFCRFIRSLPDRLLRH